LGFERRRISEADPALASRVWKSRLAQATGLVVSTPVGIARFTVAGQCRIVTGFAGVERDDLTPSMHTLPTAMTLEPPSDDPRPDGLRRAPSLLLVNTGDGKGKSSSAFGVMVRAVARGWNVAVAQFVKSGDWHVGEETIGRQLGVQWHALGDGFTWDSKNLDHDRALAQTGWDTAAAIIHAGQHQLVVLDELTYLINWGWIDGDQVVKALVDRPPHVSVVVTGRDAPAAIIDIADTVTEMRNVKHAYDNGVAAKRGIDY
jgi:cob(I)alamin adenosyltransferase